MSRHGEVTLAWGDGNYTFRLGYGELLQLQKSCDAGPDWIAQLIKSPHCRVDHVREVFRLGLIGGKQVKQGDALTKVQRFFEEQMDDYDNNRTIAYLIIERALGRLDDDALGKALGARKRKSSGSREAKSTSRNLSEPPAPSVSASPSST